MVELVQTINTLVTLSIIFEKSNQASFDQNQGKTWFLLYLRRSGVVRMYDFRHNSLLLGVDRSHFEVRKQNEKVVNFHEKFGATKTDEDELNFLSEN